MEEKEPKTDHASKTPTPPVSGPLAQLEAWLYDVLVAKAPYQLPKNAKDWMVQYGPWIALVGGILAALFIIPATFTALTFTGYAAGVLGAYGAYGAYGSYNLGGVMPLLIIGLVVLAIQLVILFMSVPLLLKKKRGGWLLVFYSSIVSLVYTILSTFSYGFFNFGNLLMGIVGAVIGLYLIFQIRSYYKN